MDSEESREAAGEASSDGNDSDSASLGITSPDGKRRRAEAPESPDYGGQDSNRSGTLSEVTSPVNFRPPSPEEEAKRSSPILSGDEEAPPVNASDDADADASHPEGQLETVSPVRTEYVGKKWISKGAAKSNQDFSSHKSQEVSSSFSRESRARSGSVSSRSSGESSPVRGTRAANIPPTEEISDGEMEFENEDKNAKAPKEETQRSLKKRMTEKNLNISHEDLSDVSDLESMGPISEDDCRSSAKNKTPKASNLLQNKESTKNDGKINGNNAKAETLALNSPINGSISTESLKYEKTLHEKANKTDDAEEQLDFEAEEGECLDHPPTSKPLPNEINRGKMTDKKIKEDDAGSGEASSLEEGEVSDDEERRPEETEPRPVCRFYSRGQCTWGVSCRFLHPGVTDKGNYTMFDMVRSMPAGYGQHPITHSTAALHAQSIYMARPEPPSSESAWERGLRTAKEMLRKACKRKEQDTDFEEKKLHLTLGGSGARGGSLGPGEEEDADLAAYAGYPPPDSPPPPVKKEREDLLRLSDRRYEDPTRIYSSRERARFVDRIPHLSPSPPPHRAPMHLYDEKLDDRGLGKSRRIRTTREVIVQRAPGTGRADEWADPWMRGGGGNRSPGARRKSHEKTSRRKERRKYSSGSSYSSSSSSRSSSRSSNSSVRSGSAGRKVNRKPRSPPKPKRGGLSPSVIVQERRAATARAGAMNPPAPSSRKRVPSPAAIRQHSANPPPPHHSTKTIVDEFGRTKPVKSKPKDRKPYSKSSSSDTSSSSSDSESESHSSSSSGSSRARKNKLPAASSRGLGGLDKKPLSTKSTGGTSLLTPKYLTDALNQRKTQIETETRKVDAPNLKKRIATSSADESAPAKKPVSRREELLKQLKAVEDAIARKRSKI